MSFVRHGGVAASREYPVKINPSWPPKDARAWVALLASVGGTMALTTVIVGIIFILWRGGWAVGTEGARIDKIGLIAVLLTVIMGVTMTGLGLAINRRSLKGGAFGATFEASGGDDDTVPRALEKGAEALEQKADEIRGEGA